MLLSPLSHCCSPIAALPLLCSCCCALITAHLFLCSHHTLIAFPLSHSYCHTLITALVTALLLHAHVTLPSSLLSHSCCFPHCHCSPIRSEEHTSELQSLRHLVCRLLLEKKKLP